MFCTALKDDVFPWEFGNEIAITFDISCSATNLYFSFLPPEVTALLLDWSHSR
jgi:hypothetical protein